MSHGKQWLLRLEQVVSQNLRDGDLSNDKIAAAIEISERHLFRRVKQLTGMSPQKFIRQYRLKRARQLLEEGHCTTVKDASAAVGYVNTSYFISQFERAFGKRPLEVLRESGWR